MKTITGIHGVPRSGTSWLAQIFNAAPSTALKFQPLFSYAFKDFLDENSSDLTIDLFFTKIYESDDRFVNMKDREIHKNYPTFNKNRSLNHLVFKQVRYHHLIENILSKNKLVKFIFIVRNPLAVLNSWKNAPREFTPEWDFNIEWRNANKKNRNRVEEYFGYEKWKEATLLFLQLQNTYPDRVQIITYKELLLNTTLITERLFEFSNIPIHENVYSFIKESKEKTISDENAVHKIKKNDNDWRKEIPLSIQKIIKKDMEIANLTQFL